MRENTPNEICHVCGASVPAHNTFCGMCGARWSTQTAHSVDRLIGQVVDGRFRIEFCLATGGMGAVYRAEHVGIGKKVAVKFLRADLRGQPALAQRLRREAMAVSKLRDIHTITVFDFGVWEGLAYLVMEFLEGQDLSKLLKDELRVDVERASGIAQQICASLTEAHELGVVHRDLKPENVFLVSSRSGEELVKVLDFGLAKLLDVDPMDGRFNTADGAILGTPCYMAPEQVAGNDVSTKADLYALGALMYRMVTGYLPFTGRSPIEVFSAQRKGQPKPFAAVYPQLDSPEYETLVFQLLSNDPDRRPDSIQDVHEALRCIQRKDDTQGSTSPELKENDSSHGTSWDVDLTVSVERSDAHQIDDDSESDTEWYSMTREDLGSGTWGFQDEGDDWSLDGSFASHLFFQSDPHESLADDFRDDYHDPLVTRLKWARRFKFLLAALLLGSSLTLGWWVYQTHYRSGIENEPNDSVSEANQLYLSHPMRGYIGKRNISEDRSDADHYRLDLEGHQFIKVSLSGVPRMDLVIDVSYPEASTGSDERPRLSPPDTLNLGGEGEAEHHTLGPFSSSTLYLTVREKWDPSVQPTENSTDAYELVVSASENASSPDYPDSSQNDAGRAPIKDPGKKSSKTNP